MTKLIRSIPMGLALVLIATAGCGRDDAEATLPPEDTFFLPTPEDEQSDSINAQAVCASDTEAYARVKARIEEYNEAIADRIALIRAVVRASQRSLERTGEFERTAERNGYEIRLFAVVNDDDTVTYQVDVTPPEEEAFRLLDGTQAADRNSGSWTTYRRDGSVAVEATWERDVDADTITVERTVQGVVAERRSTYTRTADEVTVDFVGPNHAAAAQWDRATGDGEITVDGETRVCWEAGETDGDFCTVECDGA